MRTALICFLTTFVAAGLCWGQEGYFLEPGRVVIDSNEQWERWQSVAKTMQMTDEGVRPAFIRKSTTLDIDGREVVIPGINAVLNAAEFGGGITSAGSNLGAAPALMDGRMDTYWEPDRSDLLENWWVEFDLGRSVSATRIVLKFVDEELGDPFLQFKVTTSQGESAVGPLLFRKRFITRRPVKNQRVFEIDLTKQLPTKWPNVRGDFTGDVIRYVGVGITASDYGKARRVTQAEYEALPPENQGDIEYFRQRPSGSLTLLEGKSDWDALAGSESQGPAIYYRGELPRLAEVEVWAVGDNIGTGVLERGGAVTSTENTGEEAVVVDGDFFGEPIYWSARGAYNPDLLLESEPSDLERQLVIDLGGAFFLDNIRVLQIAARAHTGPFPDYKIQLSDGSTNAGGALAWETVGEVSGIDHSGSSPTSERYNDFKFPLTVARHFAFTYRVFPNSKWAGVGCDGCAQDFALSEIQFFGEGFMPESHIESVFEGESPFIELGNQPQNLATIEWEADTPRGTDLILQTRTGNTVKSITHYYKKNGEEYPGTEEEAADAYASDKKFFGESSVGPIVTETVPGPDWSGWSQPYFESGEKITSPSPRKFVAIRAILLTEDPLAAATLHSVALNFVTPVAGTIVGEVLPSRLDSIGSKQNLSYFVRSTFEASSQGFDEILIEAPDGVDMTLKQVNVTATGQEAVTYTPGSDGFEVVMNEADSLWVRLPEPIKTTSGSSLVEVEFEATIFGYNTFFIGSAGHSQFENSWQGVEDGDANGVNDSETTVVLALERGELLGDLEVNGSFTPNGDGINDELELSFSLMRIATKTPVQVEIYDLSGRLVSRVSDASIEAGRHSMAWTGADQSGAIVPPGIYLMRIDVDVDSKSKKNTSVHRLVHLAY